MPAREEIEAGASADTADERRMRMAVEAAREAARRGEVPVGAVVVGRDEVVLAVAGNRTRTDCDPTAHAEVVALREAARRAGNYRLTGATVYSTVEPCAMCAGALVQARVGRLVYGAVDVQGGRGRIRLPRLRLKLFEPQDGTDGGRARGRVPRTDAGILPGAPPKRKC